MKKRLRKKLRVGEFQPFYFQATLCVRSPDQWPRFTEAFGDFMSAKWRRWGFGYGVASSERKFSINVGVRSEAETRREEVLRWLEQRDDVQIIAVSPVEYKVHVRLPRSCRRKHCDR